MASSFAEAVSNLNKFNTIVGIESNDNQFDSSGKPLTSSAGAIGVAQVMPKTAPEAAELAGVEFDENKFRTDKEYNKKLGKAYFEKQVQDFGDESKAAAAYNAGPTAVRKAIEKYGENWLQGVPKETQDYVAKYNAPKEKTSSSFAEAAQSLIKPKSSFAEAVESNLPEYKKVFNKLEEDNKAKEETNWAGTGPKMSFGEYMKSGFSGRVSTGLGSREEIGEQARKNVMAAGYTSQSDYNDKVGKEYEKLLGEWKAKNAEEVKAKGPEPTLGESLKGFGSELINNPGRAVAGLIYELGKDPELLGLGALAAPKAAAGAIAAGRTAKALQAVKGVGVATAKGGALGAGLETAAEASESGNLDLQKITNTAGMFAVLGGSMKGVGEVYKGVKGTPKVKPDLTPEEFETELNKFESMSDTTKSSDVGTGLASDIEAGKTLSTDPLGEVSDTGLPIKQGPILDVTSGDPLVDSSGRPRIAIMRRNADGTPAGIEINLEEIAKRFEEKPWVKLGHPEDTFKTPEQYARFILKHEEEHVLQSFDNWKLETNMQDSGIPDNVLRRQYETDINKRAKVKLDAQIEQELKDNPSLYELGDVFKDDTYTEKTGLNAVQRVLADISLNKRAAKILKESIERMIPNKQIRERITMAIEGERSTDRLLTDVEKSELLYGTGKVKPGTEFVDRGLTDVLPRMLAKIERTPDGELISYFDSKIGEQIRIPKEEYIKKYESLNHVVELLKSLPSEENAIKLQKVIEGMVADMGETAKNEGVLKALRQNYIAHVLDFSDSVLSKENQKSLLDRLNLDPENSRLNRDFSEHRMYRYIRDLEKRVYEVADEMGFDTTGLKVQRDVARIVEVYKESMGNAIIQKRLTNFLEKQIVDLPSKEKLGLITKDFKLAYENKYEQFTGYGSEALKGYMVNPDLIPALGHLFRQTDPNLVLRTASAISMLSKTITTMASMFHATSLGWARMGATPFGMLKEIGTGFSGTRAALETLRNDGFSREIDNWTRAGLKFETEDIQQGILPDVARNVDNFTTKLFTNNDVRLTRRVIDPLDKYVLQNINTLTWDFMHSAGKFATAQQIFANIKAKNPKMADQAIYNEVTSFINNTFGGLDWLKVADEVQNKTLKNLAINMTGLQGRTWMQVLMFAPDWTISTLRSYTKALPKEMFKPNKWEIKKGAQGLINPTTSGDLARRYVLTTGILYLTLINCINMAITGRPVYTNKDPTRIDLGDGTTMQLAKHSMEGPHWVLHPIKTATNKLGYLPKTAVTLASPYVNTPMDALKVIGEPFVPFQISAAYNAPTGEGLKRGAFSFMGFPIYGQTNKENTDPAILMERREKRAESRAKNKEEKAKRQ